MPRYLGKEMSRVDGVAKVTGKAKYAAEFQVPNLAYGFIVLSTVAKGTITVDRHAGGRGRRRRDPRLHAPERAAARPEGIHGGGAAARQPGRRGQVVPGTPVGRGSSSTASRSRSSSPRRTSRRATRRAWSKVSYNDGAARDRHGGGARPRASAFAGTVRRSRAAIPRRRCGRAPVKVEAEYRIPIEHHNPMEPHAGDRRLAGRQAHDLRQDAGGLRRPRAPGREASASRRRT